MLPRIGVVLPEPARLALVDLAEREYRAPQAQAALLVVEGLQRRGLVTEQPATTTEPTDASRPATAADTR